MKNIEIEKSTEGIYVDSPYNRKLGRVGMSYKKNKDIKEENDKKEEKISIKKEKNRDSIIKKSEILSTSTEKTINEIIDNMGYEIDKSKSLQDKKRSLVKNILKTSPDLKGTNKEVADGIDEILEEGFEGGFDKEEVKKDNILNNSTTLKKLNEKSVNKIIKYTRAVNKDFDIDLKLPLDQKKKELISGYIKSADLKGSNKEVANDVDEIIEDALMDI